MKLIQQISSQKGQSNNILIVVVILVVAVLAGWYLLRNKTNTVYQTNQPIQQTSTTSSIRNDNDLMSTSSDLNQEDVDGTVDTQLSQNETDAQTF